MSRHLITLIASLNFMCLNFAGVSGTAASNNLDNKPVTRVAIVGGGVGGSAAAHFLTKLFNGNIEIDLFEATSIIGGRVATQDIFGNEYESGGSIIHPKNKLAVELVRELGLSQRADTSSGVTTLVRDSEVVFSTSSWTLVTMYRILKRYGFDFNRMDSMTSDFIEQFSRIYTLFDDGYSFESVSELLSAMSPAILNLTTVNFQTFLTEQGYKEIFIDEMVEAICSVNYGQNAKGLHSLVGAISMAGAENGLWSVAGGNKNLAIALLNNSNAKVHFNRKVIAIEHLASKFELKFEDGKLSATPTQYDRVILAIPSIYSVQFQNFNPEKISRINKAWRYHRTVATIVGADGLQEKYKDLGSIISIVPNYFTSISRIHPVVLRVAEKVPVYKVFSRDVLTDAQLKEIFLNPRFISVSDWQAYPQYDSMDSINSVSNFTVFPGIYHSNNIEWAASAIEMSLIGGKNVALLIHNDVHNLKKALPVSRNDFSSKTEF